jgi:hypothetical protein
MANIFSGRAAAVTVTTAPLQLMAANGGATYRAIALPVAGTLWVGGPGVTTTGTGAGYPVTLGAPLVMQGDAVNVYQGALFGITTAICTPSLVEISS